MTSTLCIRKTPVRKDDAWTFKNPIKSFIGRRFYDHDCSLGGGTVTVGPENLGWFEGILLASMSLPNPELDDFIEIVDILRDGGTIDMWFEQ